MKVALIYPDVYEVARYQYSRKEIPPFGVMYIASVLEQLNNEVMIINVCFHDTAKDLQEYDIVGYSIPSSVSYDIIKESIAKSKIKEDALVIIGGVHPSIYPEETLLDLKPHVLCIGEGEKTIVEILEHYLDRDFSKVKGVCLLRDGKPFRTPLRKLITNIDSLPLPARHLLPQETFIMNDRLLSDRKIKLTHVMFARGCPFHCHFCASTQKIMQYRSGGSARKELIHLKERYGIEGFSTIDDNSIINKKVFLDLCKNITDLGMKWKTLSRVDQVNRKVLHVMKDSGCVEIQFGVESGSQRILTAMNKGITKKNIYQAVKIAYDIGLNVKIFLVHGYPGENLQTTSETMDLLNKIAYMVSRVNLFRFVPLPGSYAYENAYKFNIQGTHRHPDWEGTWGKFHIYHNKRQWWGDKRDFEEMNRAYSILDYYINSTFSM